MKRFLLETITVCVLFCTLITSIHAESASHSWYCKHVKNHEQPTADSSISFIESHNGFYVDHRHSDATDADKVVYLTFDAGYENGNVGKILDVLKEKETPAAFFILGNLITHDTELVKRMLAEGHTVGNHTLRHKDMSRVDNDAFLAELHALESLYKEKIGSKMASYYRPPEGRFSEENLICADQNGYKTIFWSFAYPDWDNKRQPDPEKAKQIILENLHNGEVMLLHPTSATNAAILGEIIDSIKAQGYRFGTLDELTSR
ncbi:MAG: polysaccharide deacetylase family protein [Clostridia bacterium]|nr:polysaccharide deacetylase family protein [Clostridia bacterium]